MNRAIRESMAPLEQCKLRCRTELGKLENKTPLSIVYARLRYREEKSSMFCQVRTKNQNFELRLQTVGRGMLRFNFRTDRDCIKMHFYRNVFSADVAL